MTEDERAGRIAAIAHLSSARAMIECAQKALVEQPIADRGDRDDIANVLSRARSYVQGAADDLAEPFHVADILRTVEERLVDAIGDPALSGHVLGNLSTIRAVLVRNIVRAREIAQADE